MASIIRQNIGFITAMYPSDVKIAAPYPAVNQLSGTYAAKPSSDSDTSASKALFPQLRYGILPLMGSWMITLQTMRTKYGVLNVKCSHGSR